MTNWNLEDSLAEARRHYHRLMVIKRDQRLARAHSLLTVVAPIFSFILFMVALAYPLHDSIWFTLLAGFVLALSATIIGNIRFNKRIDRLIASGAVTEVVE